MVLSFDKIEFLVTKEKRRVLKNKSPVKERKSAQKVEIDDVKASA